MTDATTWLNAHGFGSSWREGPVRSAPLVEAIEVGDVLDDGSLMTQSGLIVTGGCNVWLCERKAAAAIYYGWRRCLNFGLARDHNSGEILYPMTR